MEEDANGNLTGRIERLDWNRKVFKSDGSRAEGTAYQYYTPPQVEFVPKSGNGGGAKAAVIVSNGNVIAVELIDGGSGYTEAPKAVVTRNYRIIRYNDIEVNVIKLGVQSVVKPDKDGLGGLQITNKYGGTYSPRRYDMKYATRNGVIYPPKDPSIFEVKYPDTDIRGRVVPLF